MEKVVAMGARDVVVPGVLPIGCFPIYLTVYGTNSSADYDSLGCLRKFNDLSTFHNNLLQAKIARLRKRYGRAARIMYADFYSAVYDMVQNPSKYGTYVRTRSSSHISFRPTSTLLVLGSRWASSFSNKSN